jgi:hypothetical protein
MAKPVSERIGLEGKVTVMTGAAGAIGMAPERAGSSGPLAGSFSAG